MCYLVITLLLYGCATITAVNLDMKSEPQCVSRFDYEFKLVQKLAEIESEQKELKKVVRDLKATQTGKTALTLSLPNKLSSAEFLVCFNFQSALV